MEVAHDKFHKQLHGLIGKNQSYQKNPILRKEYNNFRKQYWRWRALEYQKNEMGSTNESELPTDANKNNKYD
jgi:hypothetical protein